MIFSREVVPVKTAVFDKQQLKINHYSCFRSSVGNIYQLMIKNDQLNSAISFEKLSFVFCVPHQRYYHQSIPIS